MNPDQGQSQETREWVARRAAADRAIAEAQAEQEKDRAGRLREMEHRVGDNPLALVIGFVLVLGVLLLGFWWFISKVECDPMISDRGMSAACEKG